MKRSPIGKYTPGNKEGFTLIELLIIMIILGVLASLISGNFITSLKKGRDARRKTDLEQIQRALEMYYEDNKAYPLTAAFSFGGQFCHPTLTCNEKVYMQDVPSDPSPGKRYEYQSNDGTSYRLYACLENNQQYLPYNNLVGTPTISGCGSCKYQDGTSAAACIWGISSPNVSP